MTVSPGRRIGPYEITARMGAGGMGEVYRATDTRLNRDVALKVLPDSFASNDDRLNRFRNEAHTLSALSHPGIVTIFEIGHVDSAPFIAMELVEGDTLRERLRAGRLSLSEAVDVVLQTARALAAAHEKGIVHRDIKPENVMIRRDGFVKVLDFGLAVLHPQGDAGSLLLTAGAFETVAATWAGTPAYMAPEQIDGGDTDPRSDVFALGVLLCEAATGANPFARAGIIETAGVIGQTPAPAAAAIATLPPDLGAIITRALQKDPSRRYPTAAEMAGDLRQTLSGLDRPPARAAVSPASRRWIAAALAVGTLVLAGGAALAYRRLERPHWVREEAIPEIATLAREERFVAAFRVIQTAERYLPREPELVRLASTATRTVSIQSTPPGARVEVADYLFPAEGWLALGTTPLEHVRIPSGYLRWRVSKPGVGELVRAASAGESITFDLDRAAKAPAGMVPVDGGVWGNILAFLGALGPYKLPPFYIDRFEVTNRQYQEFVNNGGYEQRQFWKQPFVRDGRELAWSDAMALLRDATGRSGPSMWEGGHFPDGKGDEPVSGVSWYEAEAYAEFAGKSLPVIVQGLKSAPAEDDKYVVQRSNLSGTIARAGQFDSLGPFGTYDLVGNVREWYANASGDNLRFMLGRQASSYGPETLPPFDRSPLNGFRCVLNTEPVPADAAAPLSRLNRDFAKAAPVSDEVFKIYRDMYAYDRGPLNAVAETPDTRSEDWTRQKIAFDAAYGNRRMAAFLFLPKHTKPPFQAVAFFPSARVNLIPTSDTLGDMTFVDYVIKSGRAVIYPIYQGLYERNTGGPPTRPGPTLERAILTAWSKDLGRSIDYLETRPEIDRSRIGYLGVSQGAAYGVILAALEDRLKAVVLLDGGFFQQKDPIRGIDQVDFAPRLTRPVLMVNGRFDATFPLESAQQPLMRMLGTPAGDKRHVVFDTPHDVRLRRSDLVREVLAWYDKYLGRVN